MKQKDTHKFARRVLMLLAMLFSLAGARADELTVYDGTDKNNTIPAYIFYFDEFTRSQFVIPADDLADMDIGATIEALKFYADQAYPASDKTPAPVDVYLKEVDYTDMEDKREKEGMEGMEGKLDYEDDCTIVYHGTLSTGEDNVMTIAFTEPYTYLGGNLLIGIENTDIGDYQNVYFYGLSVDNVPAISGYNGSSADNIKPTKRRFIPKTTIIYTPLHVQSLPYSEDFKDFEEGIGLWTMWNCEEKSGIQKNVGVDDSKCFGFQWSTNPPQYLISPKFDGASAMKVSFKYAIGSSYWQESFQVGYSTTSNNVKAFTWGDEITATNVNNTEWLQYEIIFPTGTKCVAIKCTSDDAYYLYLDDFSFEAFNGAYNLAASEVTATRATLDWAGSQESYNLRYRKSSDPTASATTNPAHPRYISEWTIVEDVTAPYELTGLEPETNYEWQVQGNLSDGTTEWSELSRFTTEALLEVELADAADDNTAKIEADDGKDANVKLTGRTLYQDNAWNTLCLPFDVTVDDSPLAGNGVEAKVLSKTESGLNGTSLRLYFDDAETIPAGTPFLIRWTSGSNISEPVFENVTISKELAPVTVDGLTFTGTYDRKTFTADDNILYMGANNKLYYPSNRSITTGAFRAYFQLDEGSPIKDFILDLGDGDDATGIETLADSPSKGEKIYDLTGRQIVNRKSSNGKWPRGVNIVNGKKILF